MPDLRDMELLAALGRNMHFARAAAECGISQPAFSARIRNLELDLGAPIVKRGNRFMGFTEEGEIALRWAHRMLSDAQKMRQEIHQSHGELAGKLIIGAVPTALSFSARVAADLQREHSRLQLQICSRSASEIAQGLEDGSLDAGMTYLESARPSNSVTRHLFDERYELLLPTEMAGDRRGEITWREAADFPLCLLTRNMRNRRIVDEAFLAAEVEPMVVMETDALTVSLIQVGTGIAGTIAPEMLIDSVGMQLDIVRLRLVDPLIIKPMGLVTADQDPILPAVKALAAALDRISP